MAVVRNIASILNLASTGILAARIRIQSDGLWEVVVPAYAEAMRAEGHCGKGEATQQSKTYNSTSVSCCRAFLAIVWNACSTLVASLAEVSKYGMFPLD